MKRILMVSFLVCACGAPPATTTVPQSEGEGEESKTAAVVEKGDEGVVFPAITGDPAAIAQACTEKIEAAKAARDHLVAGGGESLQDTLTLMNEVDIVVDRALGFSGLLSRVHPEKPVRDAHEACERELMEFVTAISLDTEVFAALEAVDGQQGDPLSLRSLEHNLRAYRRSGVDKDAATRERIAEIKKEMVLASQEFGRAVREGTRWVEVSPDQLEGMPQDFIDSHPPDEKGMVRISTDYPDFFPVQNYAPNEALRKDLYKEFLMRAWPENDGRLKQLLSLRSEFAGLLGFDTWADYAAAPEMAKDGATIGAFIDQIAEIARPRMEKDLAEVLSAKRKENKKVKEVKVWDRFLYVNRIREERYGVNAEEVRAYFDYAKVLEGVLAINQEFFGVTFKRAETGVWHDAVVAYDVFDEGAHLGRFFLDMHPREGKYKHMAMFHLVSGSKGRQLPIAALVCNFPEPPEGKSAYMEHNDVVTLFHEFGHLMHHIVGGQSPWLNLSGITCESEFVETPSQLLEEWAWDAEVLSRFAFHKDTGEPIPAALVKKMRDAEEFGKGMHVMRQLFYAAMSLRFHSTAPEDLDLLALTKELQEAYAPYPYEPDTYVYASFGHLVGYASEYYSYMWSLKLAKDLFTRFEKEGPLNPQTAADYVNFIIKSGGTVDAADMVEKFLGRPSNFDAFQRYLEN